jgi:hypothetical protein
MARQGLKSGHYLDGHVYEQSRRLTDFQYQLEVSLKLPDHLYPPFITSLLLEYRQILVRYYLRDASTA